MLFKKKDPHELILMKARTSRKVYIPFYITILILIFAVSFILYNDLELNKLALTIAILFILFTIKFTEIHRFSNSYEITSTSLIHTSGIINKTIKRADFFAISDLDIQQSFWQRLLNFGDINVRLFSRESTTPIKNINSPEVFADFLSDRISEKKSPSTKQTKNNSLR